MLHPKTAFEVGTHFCFNLTGSMKISIVKVIQSRYPSFFFIYIQFINTFGYRLSYILVKGAIG